MILSLMHFHNSVSFIPLYYKETGSGVLRGVFHKRLTFSFSLVSVRYQAVNITFSIHFFFLCSAQSMMFLLMHIHNGVSFMPLYYKETERGVLRRVFHKRLLFPFLIVSVRCRHFVNPVSQNVYKCSLFCTDAQELIWIL